MRHKPGSTLVFNLFLPGIDEIPPEVVVPRLPALEILLARARSAPLQGSAWDRLAQLAGGDTERWPVGPVSALGELASPPACCLRVEPLGMDAAQQGAFRLPAHGLDIDLAEAEALAAAFAQTFGDDGLRLEIARPDRWYLAQSSSEDAWRGFDGSAGALAEDARPVPPEPALSRLLSEVEMLFHAHPVNEARRVRGLPLIAGMHPWGGGRLADDVPRRRESPDARGAGAGSQPGEPFLAGLRYLGVLPRGGSVGEQIDAAGVAWPVADEARLAAQLAGVEQDLAAPLLRRLRRGGLRGIRIVSARAVHETRPRDLFKLWRRRAPLGLPRAASPQAESSSREASC